MSSNPPQCENIQFQDHEWNNIQSIIPKTFQILNQQQANLVSWLNKSQFTEKIKAALRTQEKNKQIIDELQLKLENDINQNKTFFIDENTKIYQDMQIIRDNNIEQFECLVIPQIKYEELYEHFKINMDGFDKSYFPPQQTATRIEHTHYKNHKNLWRIMNQFIHESHLEQQMGFVKSQLKELDRGLESKDQKIKIYTQNFEDRMNKLEDLLDSQQKQLNKIKKLDFDSVTNKLTTSITEIQNLKKIEQRVKDLDKQYEIKFRDVHVGLQEYIEKQSNDQVKQKQKFYKALETNIQQLEKLIEDKVPSVKLQDNDKYESIILECQKLKEQIDQQKNDQNERITQLQEQIVQGEIKFMKEINQKDTQITQSVNNEKNQFYNDINAMENSINDIFPRILKLQKDLDSQNQDIRALINLKNLDFVDNIQMKLINQSKPFFKKCELNEQALKQMLNSLNKYLLSKKTYIVSTPQPHNISEQLYDSPPKSSLGNQRSSTHKMADININNSIMSQNFPTRKTPLLLNTSTNIRPKFLSNLIKNNAGQSLHSQKRSKQLLETCYRIHSPDSIYKKQQFGEISQNKQFQGESKNLRSNSQGFNNQAMHFFIKHKLPSNTAYVQFLDDNKELMQAEQNKYFEEGGLTDRLRENQYMKDLRVRETNSKTAQMQDQQLEKNLEAIRILLFEDQEK